MQYITTAEKIGIQKGIKTGVRKGVKIGQVSLLKRQLKYKFKNIPKNYFHIIQNATKENVSKWEKRILDCHRIEDIFSD